VTDEQRVLVGYILNRYLNDEEYRQEYAISAISDIMTQQWLPVADLVRDSRDVIACGWKSNPRYFKTAIVRADAVQCWPEFTHYCELPGTLLEVKG